MWCSFKVAIVFYSLEMQPVFFKLVVIFVKQVQLVVVFLQNLYVSLVVFPFEQRCQIISHWVALNYKCIKLCK